MASTAANGLASRSRTMVHGLRRTIGNVAVPNARTAPKHALPDELDRGQRPCSLRGRVWPP